MTAGRRHGVLLLLVLSIAAGCRVEEPPQQLSIEVFNPHSDQWIDAPVALRLENYPVALRPYARVYRDHGGTLAEIPSQLDDVNGDGAPDELFFLVHLDAHETARFVARPDSERTEYPVRVSASLVPRVDAGATGDTFRQVDDAAGIPADDRARFAVVRWASERVEYRASLAEPDLTDAFAPSWFGVPGERSATSGTAQPAVDRAFRAVGDDSAGNASASFPAVDVLTEGSVLGIGTPALATRDGFAYLGGADSVEAEVVAAGPLRAIVRTRYTDVRTDGGTFDMVVEREIHAGSRWTEVRVFVADSLGERRIVTGIPRPADGPRLQSGSAQGTFYLYTLGPLTAAARSALADRPLSIRDAKGGGMQSDSTTFSASPASTHPAPAVADAASAPGAAALADAPTMHTPDSLAVILLVQDRLHPRLQPDAVQDHRVHFAAENEAASYRYMAAWDEKPEDAMTDGSVLQMIARAAARWMTPVQVSVEH